jgi:hypothetical protein
MIIGLNAMDLAQQHASKVSSWTNAASSTNPYIQTDVNKQPVAMTNDERATRPYVQFTGTQALAAAPITANIETNGGFTVMCLMRFTGVNWWERLFDFRIPDCSTGVLMLRTANWQVMRAHAGKNHNWPILEGPGDGKMSILKNEWALYAYRYTSKPGVPKLELFKNGQLLARTVGWPVNPGNITLHHTAIGAWYHEPSSKDIAAFYAYDRALTDAEMTTLADDISSSTLTDQPVPEDDSILPQLPPLTTISTVNNVFGSRRVTRDVNDRLLLIQKKFDAASELIASLIDSHNEVVRVCNILRDAIRGTDTAAEAFTQMSNDMTMTSRLTYIE